MRRVSIFLGFCLGIAGAGNGQDGAPPVAAEAAQKSEARKAYDALVARFDADVARYQKASSELRASDEYQKAYAAARESHDYTAVRALTAKLERVDYNAWAKRFADGAAEHRGKDGEVDFLLWAIRSSDKSVVAPTVQRLLGRFIRSPELVKLAKAHYSTQRTLGAEEAGRVLDRLVAESPHAEVQAGALYMRAYPVLNRRGRGPAPSDEQIARAKADMKRILEIAPDSSVAMKVQGPEFERTRLQIGMVAPDIVGTDLDGVAFKLSDYRGKVVVLDFWGDW